MSVLASGTEKKITVHEVEITVKKMSYGQQKVAMKLAKTDEIAMMDKCIIMSVVEWGIVGEGGAILPIESESLDLLDAGFVNDLAQEILSYNNLGKVEEKN